MCMIQKRVFIAAERIVRRGRKGAAVSKLLYQLRYGGPFKNLYRFMKILNSGISK